MKYNAPVQFDEALSGLARQRVLPTTLDSRGLQTLSAELRARSFFSATVTEVEILDKALAEVTRIVAGETNRATARHELRRVIQSLGYEPDPASLGGLQDLTSDRRLNLILDTNVDQARGYGEYQQLQDPDVLRTYPYRELVRVGGLPFRPRPWRSKWVVAGGKLSKSGRMIARYDDPIWTRPLSSGGFNRFGTPYAPFDFNSGMRTRLVSAAAMRDLGGEEYGTEPTPRPVELNAGVKASPNIAHKALKDALAAAGLGRFEPDGTFTITAAA